MRQYVLIVTEVGELVTAQGQLSDDVGGGSSIPTEGMHACLSGIAYLSRVAERLKVGSHRVVGAVVDGNELLPPKTEVPPAKPN